MKSRVHIGLEYKPPQTEMRRRIWVQYLRKVPTSEIAVDAEKAAEEFIHEPLNGREISNALSTARTLASFEASALKMEHIKAILRCGTTLTGRSRRKRRRMALHKRRTIIVVGADQQFEHSAS